MIGGLVKSTSTAAMFAAAGLFVGGVAMPSAKAADLGGDCCADLEERVAELEATTARKGNRRMSLTVSGQVTRSIMYWNDGFGDDVYAGLDNHNQSSRFVFSGSAKISPNVTAGFEFMTELITARTSTVNQIDEDGPVSSPQAALSGTGDSILSVRTANWWLEDKTFGRVTVGRLNVGGPVATIDLGGISTAAHYSPSLNGGGMFVSTDGALLPITYAALVGPTYGGNRMEGIRWDSPNWGGFVVQAGLGEDDHWSASLRYAGEFSGFRLAAGIGIERNRDFSSPTYAAGPPPTITAQTFTDTREWAGSLALMHVASGLFVQGHYGRTEFLTASSAFGGLALDDKPDADIWMVQAGITKNWFGLGNTSFYGEYAVARNYGNGFLFDDVAHPAFVTPIPAGAFIDDTEVRIIGVGVVQQIDAAAMELYLNWRRFTPEATACAPNLGCADISSGLEPIDMVTGGARIRF